MMTPKDDNTRTHPGSEFMYYLASPYSHKDPIIVKRRFELALMATIECMNEGIMVFSPIVHNHPVQELGGPDNSWGDDSWWQKYDMKMLYHCNGLIILTLDGWEKSVGVTAEIQRHTHTGKDIFYRDPPSEATILDFESRKSTLLV